MHALWRWAVMMNDRLKRHEKGHKAEFWASIYMALKFYRLRAKRYKTRVGEIDLVMTKSRQIIFCEVKARAELQGGLEAVSAKSQERIQRAAEYFCQRHPQFQNYLWRFDAIVVRPWRLPYHLKDAWRP